MNVITQLNKCLRLHNKNNVTRSAGLLEHFLAMQRAKLANRFINNNHRRGKLLDVGCSSYPIFLLTSKFVKKIGMDKDSFPLPKVARRFKLVNYDIEKGGRLDFEDKSLKVVTMLAIIEHIEYKRLNSIMKEVNRVLEEDGICIITTPSLWSDGILKMMSSVGLVSKVEIQDHKTHLNNKGILRLLKKANFKRVNSGYFELFLNRWFVAMKS